MNYDNAYSALVDGKRARRQSWAVKRRCIYLVPESVVPFENIRTPHVTAETTGREAAHISSHVDMICDDGTIWIGWKPAYGDVAALDWEII